MYEGSLCVCCMSTDDLVEFNSSNYSKMLSSCLSIHISESDGHDSICESCTSRLRDCVSFKRQVLKSVSILSSCDISQLVILEDLEILGLKEQKEQEIDISERLAELPNIEVDEKESNKASSPKPTKVKAKMKRKVGRPRKHPKNIMPYKIGKDEFKCRECDAEFPNNITLKVHYNSHFGNHVCGTCGKGFMTQHSLKKHETSHLKGPFPCSVCGQEFRNLNTLHSHNRHKHGTRAPFPCGECGAEFRTVQRRLAHAAQAHGRTERRYRCRYCHKRFMSAGERSKHISERHEIKLFPCPLCGVEYKKYYMRAHLIRRHSIGKGYACTVCTLVQPTRSALAMHMQSHLGDRRYVCKLCSKAFVQKCSLKYHVGSHIRRGQYIGDPTFLMLYKDNPDDKDTGILSDKEEEQYLDESLLSELSDDSVEQSLDQSIDLIEDMEQLDEILLDDERFKLPSDLDLP